MIQVPCLSPRPLRRRGSRAPTTYTESGELVPRQTRRDYCTGPLTRVRLPTSHPAVPLARIFLSGRRWFPTPSQGRVTPVSLDTCAGEDRRGDGVLPFLTDGK